MNLLNFISKKIGELKIWANNCREKNGSNKSTGRQGYIYIVRLVVTNVTENVFWCKTEVIVNKT